MMSEDRKKVIALSQKRRILRTHFLGEAKQAKHDLHPRTLIAQWKGRKRQQFSSATKAGKKVLVNNASLIGIAGASILLFTARKPIFRLYNQFRNKARQAKDRTS